MEFSSFGGLVNEFQKSLIVTNRTADFFVDWSKVRENTDILRMELSLMNSLVGSKSFEADFKVLAKRYPEVLRVIPILITVRELEFPVIMDFFDLNKGVMGLDFNMSRGSKLSDEEIDGYYRFVKNSGLSMLFESVKNLYDYVFGVEVGMDTNARKNRSGTAMEQLLKPVIEGASRDLGARCLFQKNFGFLGLTGKVPASLVNRKTDFIVYKGDRFVNIEVNYFQDSGSKPEEIVDSYINRKRELESYGWAFIWVTDGNVWSGSGSQLSKAFQNMDYVLNISLSSRGLLKAALEKVLR